MMVGEAVWNGEVAWSDSVTSGVVGVHVQGAGCRVRDMWKRGRREEEIERDKNVTG